MTEKKNNTNIDGNNIDGGADCAAASGVAREECNVRQLPKKTIDEIAAACATCGNCLHTCPVYNVEWTEPSSPRGKINIIKSLQDGKLEPGELSKKFISQCLLCGSCQNTCTNGVQFMDMMLDYRNKLTGGQKLPWFKKTVLYFYQSVLLKKFAWVMDIFAATPLKKHLLIPRRKRANLKKYQSKGNDDTVYDVLFFPGCVMTIFYPEIAEQIYTFLQRKGFSVAFPKDLECCGFPFLSQGWTKKYKSLKQNNENVFSRFKYKYILAPCGTGVMTFRNHYGIPEDVEVLDLTEFFHRFLPDEKVDVEKVKASATAAGVGQGKVTWHDPCHELKILGLGKESRHYMSQLGDDFVDDKSALCCGFGGIFSVGFPSTSKKIFKRKENRLNELGASTVVTSCPGCYLQLREHLPHDVKFFIELF